MDWLSSELRQLEASGLRRRLPSAQTKQGPLLVVEGQPLVNFASNDYLSLAADPRLIAAAVDACCETGVGRGASPLICGRASAHEQLERRLAEWLGESSALLFPTGFAANSGIVPALVDEPDALYADEKNHASLIDGCRLSRAARHIYPHNDYAALDRLLSQGAGYRRRLIVTDAMFSMDGDLAPLPQLAALAQRYEAMLLVDEAHATGVLGSGGRGAVEHFDDQRGPNDPSIRSTNLIRVGTLSKAFGAAGGFVCGTDALIEWIANRARSYVFSTAAPAPLAAAALTALEIAIAEPQRRRRLLDGAKFLRRRLGELGWSTGRAEWHILPLKTGSPESAVALSRALQSEGYWAPAIRPPSVPEGESMLRLSLRSDHTDEMLQGFVDALERLAPQ